MIKDHRRREPSRLRYYAGLVVEAFVAIVAVIVLILAASAVVPGR